MSPPWRRALLVALALTAVAVATLAVRDQGPPEDLASTARTADDLGGLGRPGGFARGTSGGTGGPIRIVQHLQDGGPGSLRAALSEPGPAHVRFTAGLEGLLTLRDPLLVPSDITIDGRGAKVIIDNYGLHVDGARNVVIAYLQFDFAAHFDDYKGNAAILVTGGSRNVWITHCTFVGGGPEQYNQALLLIDGAERITASWNRFDHWDRTIMTGQDAVHPELAADLITLHHNLFYRTYQRNPLVRFSRVHTFNNWLFEFGYPGTGTGMVVDAGGQLVSEGDLFEDAFNRYALKSGDWGSGATPGLIRHEDALFVNVDPELIDEVRPEVVFDPRTYYDYDVETPGDALRERLRERAGWQPVPHPFDALPQPRAGGVS